MRGRDKPGGEDIAAQGQQTERLVGCEERECECEDSMREGVYEDKMS